MMLAINFLGTIKKPKVKIQGISRFHKLIFIVLDTHEMMDILVVLHRMRDCLEQ